MRRATAVLGRLRAGRDAAPADPAAVMRAAGQAPDPWQQAFLTSAADRELLLCCRGAGKSRVTAARTLWRLLATPGYKALFFSPTQRQSTELLGYLYEMWQALGRPCAGPRRAPQEAATSLKLANGSRVLSLPDNQRGVRGFHVDEVVLDEGSQISDALYLSVRPMVLRRRGRITALSTPFGQRGWYYEEWLREDAWRRVCVTAGECGRYTPEQLAEERQAMGERWYKQEFECSFEAAVGAVFSAEEIAGAMSADVAPLRLSVEG